MQKLLPGHISIYVFDPAATPDWENPDASELEAALASGIGADISCAIEAGYTLNADGYETDDSRSICDIGEVSTATFRNYSASLDGFRSDPDEPTAVYDLFYEWFSAGVGRNVFLVKRIGPEQGDALAAGQVISIYGFEVDYGTDVVDDNTMALWGARFLPNGQINTNVTLVA